MLPNRTIPSVPLSVRLHGPCARRGLPRLLARDTFTSPVTFTAVGQSVFKATQSIMRNALSLMADECVTAPDSAALLGDGAGLTSVNQQLKARGRIYIYWCNIYMT